MPAFSEADAIGPVLRELAADAADASVLVVDDGSPDLTADVATAHGARVLRLPFNLGVGAAVRTGLRYAEEHGYERVVVVDADGQHDPAEISGLVRALDQGADLVVGSRFAAGAQTYEVGRLRRIAMRSLARTVQRITDLELTDVTSGFRAFDRKAIELLAKEYPSEYLADTVEVLLVAHYAGLRIVEVPVTMRPRATGTSSSRGFRLMIDFLRLRIGIASAVYRRGRSHERRDRA